MDAFVPLSFRKSEFSITSTVRPANRSSRSTELDLLSQRACVGIERVNSMRTSVSGVKRIGSVQPDSLYSFFVISKKSAQISLFPAPPYRIPAASPWKDGAMRGTASGTRMQVISHLKAGWSLKGCDGRIKVCKDIKESRKSHHIKYVSNRFARVE